MARSRISSRCEWLVKIQSTCVQMRCPRKRANQGTLGMHRQGWNGSRRHVVGVVHYSCIRPKASMFMGSHFIRICTLLLLIPLYSISNFTIKHGHIIYPHASCPVERGIQMRAPIIKRFLLTRESMSPI